MVEDIILSVFDKLLHHIDPYLVQLPNGLLHPQKPTQFVDDTHVCSRSIEGAQFAIIILQIAGPILNIFINPLKTRHIMLQWKAPPNRKSPLYTIREPYPCLFAKDRQGRTHSINPVPLDTMVRILGAQMSPLDADKNFVTMMQKKAQAIASILKRKKCTVKLLDRVLRQCIFPMLSYSCQFAAISTDDLNTISGPIRDAISFIIKGSSLNNKVTFAGEGLHYGLPFTDLADQC
jgi:hypothetical protein